MEVSKWINRAFPVFSSQDSVSDVLKVEEKYDFITVVVHDEAGKLLGVIKRKELANYAPEKKLAEIVKEPEYFSYDTDIIEDVVLMLIESHDLVIPVVSGDMNLKGVITVFDILEALMEFTSNRNLTWRRWEEKRYYQNLGNGCGRDCKYFQRK